jgi:NADP-dependent alcohol dehydrogenase
MYNFNFYNPVKLIFGKDAILSLGDYLDKNYRIMVVYGGGSFKKNLLYNQLISALEGYFYIEFWGVEPNPTTGTLNSAIVLAKENNIDFILAVGGGSVIDGAKYISAGIKYEGDGWDFVLNPTLITQAVPLAAISTLPAAGSEMNNTAVVSNTTTNEKFPFVSDFCFPKFCICDPQATYSLSNKQLAYALADSFSHAIEVYINKTDISPLMDRWAEGILLTLIEIHKKVLNNHKDYDTMASFVLTATMAVNGFIGMGVPRDFASHRIGHELTALTGITHGHTLALILPGTLEVMKYEKWDKLLQYAARIWNITEGSEEHRVQEAIARTRNYFSGLGLSSCLTQEIVRWEVCEEIVKRFKDRGTILGENKSVTPEIVEKILKTIY